MKLKIGTHVSFTKDETLTDLILSLDDNIDVFQVYLGNRCGGDSRVLDPKDVDQAVEVI